MNSSNGQRRSNDARQKELEESSAQVLKTRVLMGKLGRQVLDSIAGISPDLTDGRNHPCPKCGGADRFAAFSDVEQTGGVNCRKCHSEKNADFLAAIQWMKGCDFPTAIKLVREHLDGQHPMPTRSRIVATYDYCDESGAVLFQVVRQHPKNFYQRRPDGDGKWKNTVKGVRVVPFRLPELLARPDETILIPEGEKDVLNLAEHGFVATCNAGGAGKWKPEHTECLAGRRVVILPDHDDAGEQHASLVSSSLRGIAADVKIVRLPGLAEKGDVSDWLAAGGTADELRRLIGEAESVANEWPELQLFDEPEPLPEFPVNSLPSPLREWVAAEAEWTQTPPDLAGWIALAACSSAINSNVEVAIRGTWKEPANIYVAVILESGNRKSAVFDDAFGPIRQLERDEAEADQDRYARDASRRRQDERRLSVLEKRAAEKGDIQASSEAVELSAQMQANPVKLPPRRLVDDATEESLAKIMSQQGGRITSASPEGGPFDLMAGKYNKSSASSFVLYLKAYTGETVTMDRIGRAPVVIQRPLLVAAYTVQPCVVHGLGEDPSFRGRGLLARFMYARPGSWIGYRKVTPPPVPVLLTAGYGALIRSLAAHPKGTTLRLSQGACESFIEWQGRIEKMLRPDAEMGNVIDWGAKLAGQTARIAAILHCVTTCETVFSDDGSIQEDTMKSAIVIAEYAIPHAIAAMDLLGETPEGRGTGNAETLVGWIRDNELTEFSQRDAHRRLQRKVETTEQTEAALTALVNRGYIRPKPQPTSGPGRPPSPQFDVNPAVAGTRQRRSASPTDAATTDPAGRQEDLTTIEI